MGLSESSGLTRQELNDEREDDDERPGRPGSG
jgi:hypothetical protein